MVSRILGAGLVLGAAAIAGCSEQEAPATSQTNAAAPSMASAPATAPAQKDWRSSLVFYASWDEGADADFAVGDPKIYTTESVKHETFEEGIQPAEVTLTPNGRFGGALEFAKDIDPVITYRGRENMGYKAENWDITISFWMSTDKTTLPPLFIDPIQAYERDWNDGAIWVDFPREPPAPNRQFRLAVPSDAQHWNPDGTHINAMPRERQPMVIVEQADFSPDKWSHVAMVIEGINSTEQMSSAKLYLDGKLQGVFEKDIRITWGDNVAIMLGIKYIGRLDDLAIFDQALDRHQVEELMNLEGGVKNL